MPLALEAALVVLAGVFARDARRTGPSFTNVVEVGLDAFPVHRGGAVLAAKQPRSVLLVSRGAHRAGLALV